MPPKELEFTVPSGAADRASKADASGEQIPAPIAAGRELCDQWRRAAEGLALASAGAQSHLTRNWTTTARRRICAACIDLRRHQYAAVLVVRCRHPAIRDTPSKKLSGR